MAHGQDKPEIVRSCDDDCQCERKNIGNCCGSYPSCVRRDFEPDLEGMSAWCLSSQNYSVCGFSTGPCKCQAGECVDGSPTITCPAVEPVQSVCGTATDSCMNDDNFVECRDLEDNGCDSIQIMESCPVQFSCSDDATGSGPSSGPANNSTFASSRAFSAQWQAELCARTIITVATLCAWYEL